MGKWYLEALADAWETGYDHADEMVEQWRASGEVSDDLSNDYSNGGAYHHESHVDRDYNLTDAANLLDELSEWEETDDGLWDGLEPRRAIAAQAAFTYGNAVYDLWRRHVVEGVNGFLGALDDTLPEDVSETDKADAGERLIRLFVLLGEELDDATGDEKTMIDAAWAAVQAGDTTAIAAYADWCSENDKSGRESALRGIAAVRTEESQA